MSPGPSARGVQVLDALDAAAVRAWAATSVQLLTEHRAEIDALNVFPVADGDTGANMLATARAGAHALAQHTAEQPAALLAAWAAGAARGAAGNSGFIVAELLRGLAEAAGSTPTVDGSVLAAGLEAGARLARAAVVAPVAGTVLTVADAAAQAAVEQRTATLSDVARTALDAATAAVERTTSQLAPLRAAGVVDAGGRGLAVVLTALCQVVEGHGIELPTLPRPDSEPVVPVPSPSPGYEVQYLLDPVPGGDPIGSLTAVLAGLGDSVVVLPVDTGWKVHAHVDDVGAAIEAGLAVGRPHAITVTDLHRRPDTTVAVVAVAPSSGLATLFEREGVQVVTVPADGAVTVEALRAAIESAGARQVVLLPNTGPRSGVAEAAATAARRDGFRVAVVPTRSPVQGLAAVAVHDSGRDFDDDVVAMAEAAAATRWAEIVVADTQALTAAGVCHPGDVLGLIDGEVVLLGGSVLAVAFGVLDRLVAVGGELMTVLVGPGAPPRAGQLVEQHVRERAQLVDVVVYSGGLRDVPIMIGVE